MSVVIVNTPANPANVSIADAVLAVTPLVVTPGTMSPGNMTMSVVRQYSILATGVPQISYTGATLTLPAGRTKLFVQVQATAPTGTYVCPLVLQGTPIQPFVLATATASQLATPDGMSVLPLQSMRPVGGAFVAIRSVYDISLPGSAPLNVAFVLEGVSGGLVGVALTIDGVQSV